MTRKEKLVVEVVAAHNLMPKDGEGSSSPFVEVEFENQRLRTQVKYKDLNPIWNQKLVFHIKDVADLSYRAIEVNVFNERRSSNSRNFLGKVRVSGSSVAKQGEEVVQLHTLDKRSLFSHIRGEISLKLYVSRREEVKEVGVFGNGEVVSSTPGSSHSSKKNKKIQQQNPVILQQPQQLSQEVISNNKQAQEQGQNNNNAKPVETNPGGIQPVVTTAAHGPGSLVSSSGGSIVGPAGGNGLAGFSVHSNGSSEFSLKETSPHLGGGRLNKDKTSSTYDLVELMQYLYVRVVKAKCNMLFGGGEVVAEVKLGNYRGVTKKVISSSNVEWDQVFAFSKDCIQSSMVEVFVKQGNKDDYLGRVWFDLNEVPRRVPPDSQLAPQWYRMEDKKGDKSKGLMPTKLKEGKRESIDAYCVAKYGQKWMHYVQPLSVNQLDAMRYQAMNVVASRLSRAEPPLGREVVEYMLDHDSHMWSMRRSKANFARLISVLSVLVAMARWVESMRNWHKPVYSTLFVLAFLLWVAMPELIIPSLLLYMAFVGLWRYRARPRHPPHMDTKLSHVVSVYSDELDEEFDSFPTSRSAETVRMRYDRLRSVAGRIQTVVGDMASQGERFQALLGWRDPRATFLFVVMCLFAAVGFYAVPIRVVVALWGLYVMRPPKFRNKLPPRALSFFRRLPTKADSLL
ncbi:hypothetical protein D5086_005479 [Populus alba]|uniref:Uncharacterized protein n=1 Tax=Populus alba TaxID=43335 RepID=A0ACC4CTE3_POPAL